jgi:predicted nucleic acid-binding protein
MIYWDTSCVVKLYAKEPDSDFWIDLGIQRTSPLFSSILLTTELTCALRAKEFRNEIRPGATENLVHRFFQDLQAERFRCLPITPEITKKASHLAIDWKQNGMLRTLDALHLATCLHLECSHIATADIRLREAACAVGLKPLGG